MGFLAAAIPSIIGAGVSLIGGGKKPAQSDTSNLAFGQIKDTYTPLTQTGVGATNFLGGLLGLPGGDTAGANAGLQNYYQQAGFEPALKQMSRQVVSGGAASGLLNSGPTQRRLLQEGANINQGFYNNYLQNLMGMSDIGLKAGSLISNAGNRSTSTGEKESFGSRVGSALQTGAQIGSIFKSAFPSDIRLKTDIVKTDEMSDGLGIYDYRYKGCTEPCRGVMADEVAVLRPWALGPTFMGYMTVNYEAL